MRLYTPPTGFYDLPFSWVYDGRALVDGADAPNQFVYIQGGYGDFVMRRAVGFDRVLTQAFGVPGGTFQMRDSNNEPLQAYPVVALAFPFSTVTVPPVPDLGFAPEVIYQETGKVGFDLFNVQRPAAAPATAQVAFQGVRRMKGNRGIRPSYKARAKTFTYILPISITQLLDGTPITSRLKIDDYDFELYRIDLVKQAGGSITVVAENSAEMRVTAVLGAPTFSITFDVSGPPGTPFSISIIGNNITVTAANTGSHVTTGLELLNAWNADPAALAFATLGIIANGSSSMPPLGTTTIAGNSFSPVTDPISKLWIYDSNKVAISSAPMLDIYCDATPGGVYENGAIVTPLWYPKDSQFQVDLYSMLTDPADLGTILWMHLVGRQYIPC